MGGKGGINNQQYSLNDFTKLLKTQHQLLRTHFRSSDEVIITENKTRLLFL